MKQCFKCHRVLPLDGFYPHPRMADGHLNKCKECTKGDVREHRKKNPAVVRLREQVGYRQRRAQRQAKAREWREANRDRSNDYRRAYTQRNTEKRAAAVAVNNALRDGRLVRPDTCDFCHEACEVEGHHWDYGQPLVVSWLCRRCHRIADHARREAEARLQRKTA